METVYKNNRIGMRMGLAIIVVGFVSWIGVWLLGARYPGMDDGDPERQEVLFLGIILLAVAVLGAIRFGHYGLKTVVRLDADRESGRARVALWRPMSEEVVETLLQNIIEWRYEVGRRNTKMPIRRFRARIAEPHYWLLFELNPREPLSPVFRELAPEAVREYEEDTGIAYLRDEPDRAD